MQMIYTLYLTLRLNQMQILMKMTSHIKMMKTKKMMMMTKMRTKKNKNISINMTSRMNLNQLVKTIERIPKKIITFQKKQKRSLNVMVRKTMIFSRIVSWDIMFKIFIQTCII